MGVGDSFGAQEPERGRFFLRVDPEVASFGAMEIGPLRERANKLTARLEILRGHL